MKETQGKTKKDVTFEYESNSNSVLLTGSFINWKDHIPMIKEGNIFKITLNLCVGIHYYKFIVDGIWMVDNSKPTIIDVDGNINNCINVEQERKKKSSVPQEWTERSLVPCSKTPNIINRNQLLLPGVKLEIKTSGSDIPLSTYASGSNSIIDTDTKHKLLIVTVGLPGRGKSFISQKLARYLEWLGWTSKVFDINEYRIKHLGKHYNAAWYHPDNSKGFAARERVATLALNDIFEWYNNDDGIVAILDGTNISKERREMILNLTKKQKPQFFIRTIFLEIIVNDPDVVKENIRSMIESPDYKGIKAADVLFEYSQKIKFYEQSYDPIDDCNRYIRLYDNGEQIVVNRVRGFLPSKMMFYLSNLRSKANTIYFVRHGESEYNRDGKIGGDSPLTSSGEAFAHRLRDWVSKNITNINELVVWTSTLERAVKTAEDIPCSQYICWKSLGEIDAGICNGMTYEEIEKTYPKEYKARQKDKLRYRYPRGESYEDVIRRIEPVIIELDRRDKPVLVIGHQAVLRCLYGYFSKQQYTREQIPHIEIPIGCILKVTPQAFASKEEKIYI